MSAEHQKKNSMTSGNFARSLGVAKGIGRVLASRGPISKKSDNPKSKASRHKEYR